MPGTSKLGREDGFAPYRWQAFKVMKMDSDALVPPKIFCRCADVDISRIWHLETRKLVQVSSNPKAFSKLCLSRAVYISMATCNVIVNYESNETNSSWRRQPSPISFDTNLQSQRRFLIETLAHEMQTWSHMKNRGQVCHGCQHTSFVRWGHLYGCFFGNRSTPEIAKRPLSPIYPDDQREHKNSTTLCVVLIYIY